MSADLTVPPHIVKLMADVRKAATNQAFVPTAKNTAKLYAADAALYDAIASLLRAAPPLPVVAYASDDTGEFYTPEEREAYHIDPADPIVRKADADAAIASLQARLEAAERDAARYRKDSRRLDAIERNMWFVEPQYQDDTWRAGKADEFGRASQAGKTLRAAIDAATSQEGK